MCIFAEGSMTRTGNMLKFRRGLERIAAGVNCPIVPIYLDGVWGSIFSYERGSFVFKMPKHLFQPISVSTASRCLRPRRPTRSAARSRTFEPDLAYHKKFQKPLHIGFIRRASEATLERDAGDRRGRLEVVQLRRRADPCDRPEPGALWNRGGQLVPESES